MKLIPVDYRGIAIGIRPFKSPRIIGVDVAVDEKFRLILVQQREKSGKSPVGKIREVVHLISGGMGDKNVEAFMPPQFEGESADSVLHLPFGVLVGGAGNIPHGAAQPQNADAPVDKNIILDAGTAFGRIQVEIFVVVSHDIEERHIAEGHKKTQIFLRQVAAGNNEIDIFHPFGIIIIVEQFRLMIRHYHNF